MKTTNHSRRLNREALRRIIREIDARPAVAWKRDEDSELVAQRLRRFPEASLRQRVAVS
jgi:hypothetical protein